MPVPAGEPPVPATRLMKKAVSAGMTAVAIFTWPVKSS
jgi:hypothetical protein